MLNSISLSPKSFSLFTTLCVSPEQVFANSLGISKSALIRYETGERFPDAWVVAAIVAKYNIDATWLLTGNGDPKLGERYVFVPFYDIGVSAGHGAFSDSEVEPQMMAVDRLWLKKTLGLSPNEVSIVNIMGDSMEPTLRDGDLGLISTNPHVMRDGIHVTCYGGMLQIKRIQRQPGGIIKVTSDNPAYEPFLVKLGEQEDFKLVGRLVWSGRKLGV